MFNNSKCKRALICVVTAIYSVILTGCCITHEFSEATCIDPQICVKCGEIQGEPLGHNWSDATCVLPKTCTVCGETDGEALGHSADKEANYQEASICTVCNEVLEEAKTAFWKENSIAIATDKIDTEIPYETICYDDNTLKTIGNFFVSDFEVIDGNDNLESADGYKWVKFCMNLNFDDDNAWEFGAQWAFRLDDYYNPQVVDDSFSEVGEDDALSKYGAETFTLNWYGQDYDRCIAMDDPDAKKAYIYEWKDKTLSVKFYKAIRIPEGYDGFVVSAVSANDSETKYIYEIKPETKESLASILLPEAK